MARIGMISIKGVVNLSDAEAVEGDAAVALSHAEGLVQTHETVQGN
jgi:hypothetical protein